MIGIQTLDNIAKAGLDLFPKADYTVDKTTAQPQAILVRSYDLHSHTVPDSVLAVGRAGAGTNTIPVDALSQRGIPVFNTPGANANAVKELVIAGLLIASRHICRAWQYTQALTSEGDALTHDVEAGKRQFIGQELPNKTLGVVGLGAIGVQVANAARALGMRVVGYDPTISVQRAWELSADVQQADSLPHLLAEANYVSLHVPLLENTKHLLDKAALERLDREAIVLNFARAEVVDEASVIALMQQGHLQAYVCDFPSAALRNTPRVIALPHLGASTREAQENCAIKVAGAVRDFLENGNITHAVNFPDVSLPYRANIHRIGIVNANIPSMVAKISTHLSDASLNILDFINKSRGDIAYTLIDVDAPPPPPILEKISATPGILRARSISPRRH